LKKATSLQLQFVVIFTIFIVILCSVMSVLAIRRVIVTSSGISAREGINIVNRAGDLIDGDAFEALSKSLDENDPYYETTRLKLLALKKDFGCLYL
jgi:methyl-accepting chemotaxis protein